MAPRSVSQTIPEGLRKSAPSQTLCDPHNSSWGLVAGLERRSYGWYREKLFQLELTSILTLRSSIVILYACKALYHFHGFTRMISPDHDNYIVNKQVGIIIPVYGARN